MIFTPYNPSFRWFPLSFAHIWQLDQSRALFLTHNIKFQPYSLQPCNQINNAAVLIGRVNKEWNGVKQIAWGLGRSLTPPSGGEIWVGASDLAISRDTPGLDSTLSIDNEFRSHNDKAQKHDTMGSPTK